MKTRERAQADREETLQFYKTELHEASEKGDMLRVAQTFKNIQDFTGWGISRIAGRFKSAPATITTWLNILKLPENMLGAWAAQRMSNTVAIEFLKVPADKQQAVFESCARDGISLKQLTPKVYARLKDARTAPATETLPPPPAGKMSAPTGPPGPKTCLKCGAEIIEGACKCGIRGDAGPGQPRRFFVDIESHRRVFPAGNYAGLICRHACDATTSLMQIQKLSSVELENDAAEPMDRHRARNVLRNLIVNAETVLSLLDHVERVQGTRKAAEAAYA